MWMLLGIGFKCLEAVASIVAEAVETRRNVNELNYIHACVKEVCDLNIPNR